MPEAKRLKRQLWWASRLRDALIGIETFTCVGCFFAQGADIAAGFRPDQFLIGRMSIAGVAALRDARLYAFGFWHMGKLPECAVTVLHNEVVPFYTERGLVVSAVLTDKGSEFCDTSHKAARMLP